MTNHRFADFDFDCIGSIEPQRGPTGAFIELMPQARYRDAANTPLHAYGSGPFCRFRIGRGLHTAGLYVLTLDVNPVYVGECVDLDKRWGPTGYGGISPRNCFRGGQPTNCRLNAAILASAKEGRKIELWFRQHDGNTLSRVKAESELIRSLRPQWNRTTMTEITR